MIAFIVDGDPVGKGRPRLTTRGGFARAYTPAPTAAWEAKAAWHARNAWANREPIEEPIVLEVLAVAARPKRLLRKCDPDGRMWRTTKPDGDNVLKAVADALVNAGVVRDDVYVVEWRCRSLYAARTEGPCVEVRVCLAGDL